MLLIPKELGQFEQTDSFIRIILSVLVLDICVEVFLIPTIHELQTQSVLREKPFVHV